MEGLSIHSWVESFTGPVNLFLGRYAHLITYAIVALIIFRVIQKARNLHNAKAYKKTEAGSTNEWFSWEKFNKWKESKQHENQNR